ncbi:Putative DNA ligase, ATP-dependent, nucleic acid-binding protein [Septoria linicola]|uniref:DNA ligase n=1 Tax=Septoria linicola TaxID=215465 RepID=A0A9Q9AHS0_9PEZI|nr:putative DNA ligase, ATP-dependent, nucleic acid-binding protein [Septoria linicola]USW47138.1 Putative DNA ligase, ATP-dependent, nucleic acid-binding protein [Septoria linicola]
MPPKQAKLGYVVNQQTLGKFFGNPNGSKATPQQSKLSFGSKAAPKEEDETPPSGTNGVVKEEDVDMVDDADVKAEESESPDRVVKQETSPSKKRRVNEDAAEDEDMDDDEPPTKKARSKPPQTGRKASIAKETAVKKEVPAKSSKTVPVKAKPASVDDGEDADDGAVKATTAASGRESEQSEQEEEEEEEEVKPAKAAKAVQSTLKADGKDFYPDWKAGDPVPYAALCTTFSKIEMTTKRLEILAHCARFLRQVLRLTPDDLLPVVLLMVGKLAADYAGIELGIGESLIMKAIGESTGRSLKVVKEDQQKVGDLGLVAAKSRGGQPMMFKPKPLTVRAVHEGLMKIATVEGQGAQGRKVDGIKKLLSSADINLAKGATIDINENKGGPSESKFIIRALEGKMRLGLADKNLQVAVAHAMVFHSVSKDGKKVPTEEQLKKGEEIFKAVYNELPAYEVIVPALLEHGIWDLRQAVKLRPGVPLKPMLAKPTKSLGEVLDRFDGKDFTCEYKYDGERAQIHYVAHEANEEFAATVAPAAGKSDRGISNIFSRNSEDLSKKYPDILEKLPRWVKKGTKSFVLDCETVAWDVEKKHVLPFQQLMTRKKKDVKTEDIKVKVCVFAFDILYLDGQAMVNKSFRDRRDAMYGAFEEIEGEFAFAKFGNSKEVEEIQILLEDSIKASCEGLMVKMLDGVESYYEPSRRSQNWLKVKKDYLAGAGDSLDLVVLGAYYGKGKRTNWYGAFQLACYNEHKEQYETVCNIGTGFSEALLAELYETLSPLAIDRAKPFYDHSTGKNDQPDVWFEPKYVWEVKTADFTLSPKYRAASSEFGSDGTHKGVSLRFPRFLRVRDDKKPEEATSSKQVAEMYRKQESVGKNKGPSVDDDFEY